MVELLTVTAKVTKTKYVVNRWWHLQAGEKFTAPRVVVECLKGAGLVE